MLQDDIETFRRYLQQEQNASELTVSGYCDDLEMYRHHAESLAGCALTPSEADLDLVRSWLGSMMEAGLRASSVARRLAAVKAFYRYLLKTGQIQKNPISKLRAPKGEKPLPVYVPTEEIEQILAQEPAPEDWVAERDRLIIAMLYECGLRRSELAGLQDKDVDSLGCKLKVLGKGNKERIVPFGQGLKEQINRWRITRDKEFGDSVTFFLTLKGKPMTGADVYRVVHRELSVVPNLARRGAHALRHSFATDMLNNGAELVAIKELMGHSQISTTVRYTHTSFKQLQSMYNAHPRAKKKN